MRSWRLSGVLWILAGLSSAVLVPVMTDPALTAAFAIGAVVGIGLGIACFARPDSTLASVAAAVGLAWVAIFGAITLLHLGIRSRSGSRWPASRSSAGSAGSPRTSCADPMDRLAELSSVDV